MRRILLSMLLAATSVRADDPAGGYFDAIPLDCAASSEIEFEACVGHRRKAADAELNSVYAELVKHGDAAQKTQLRDMQRAWIALRDAQCALVEGYHAGAANPSKWKAQCEAAMTIERVRELRQLGTGIMWGAEETK